MKAGRSQALFDMSTQAGDARRQLTSIHSSRYWTGSSTTTGISRSVLSWYSA